MTFDLDLMMTYSKHSKLLTELDSLIDNVEDATRKRLLTQLRCELIQLLKEDTEQP